MEFKIGDRVVFNINIGTGIVAMRAKIVSPNALLKSQVTTPPGCYIKYVDDEGVFKD